ncbi:MAG: flagellar hook-associated protein FlgK [Pseudomonadota bacterium]
MTILSTSLSALRVSQRVLEVTANNIANVNTPGYSRQRVAISAQQPTEFGFGFIGNGATIAGIDRIYDEFLGGELTRTTSEVGRLDAMSNYASRLGSLFNDPDFGLAATMQTFFNAANEVSNDPASISARENMLGETRVVVGRFNELASQIESLDSEINARIAEDVSDIGALAEELAQMNSRIARNSGAGGGQVPNDLIDQRNELVNELAGLVGITTAEQEDGALNVFLGSGQLLVRGATASQISTEVDPLDSNRLIVQLGVQGGESDITRAVQGGSLGGLLEFAGNGLSLASNQLGRIATGFALEVNEQHRNGMDFDGELGVDMFSIADPVVVEARTNTGSAGVEMTIGDLESVGTDNFVLRFDGVAFSVTNESTNTIVPFTGTGTSADPLTFEGLELVVAGTPAAGDQFSLQPFRDAAFSLELAISNGRDVAAASPVVATDNSDNIGTGSLVVDRVVDPSDAGLLTSSTIVFTSPTAYEVNGSGPFTYTAGAPFQINGVEVTLDGTPETGDEFTLSANTGGIGDNRNMLAISGIPAQGSLDGGRETLNDAVTTLVSQTGINGREAARGLAAQQSLLEQAEFRVLEVSGVNLDEEAARLLQFQQSYEAAAQMIAVADSLFATLINAVNN